MTLLKTTIDTRSAAYARNVEDFTLSREAVDQARTAAVAAW